jgi:hypothetical protein
MVNQVSEQPTSKEPVLADYLARWSTVNVVAHEQERSAREDHATALIAWLRAELEHREKYWAQFDHYPKGSAHEPCPDCDPYCHCFKPVESMDSDLVCGNCGKPFHEAQRASQPPSLLREVAAIAYDTSKAAEDRIRDIQDLWEGATAPPSAWQPIETAPKNRRFLAANDNGNVYACRWGDGANIWQDDAGQWRDPKSWTELPTYSVPTKSGDPK